MTTLTQAQKALKSISYGSKIRKISNDNDFIIYGGIKSISFDSIKSFNTIFDVKDLRIDGGYICLLVTYPKECHSLG